jgi:thiol-disulfide isomerase/thioredoxin
MFAKTKLNDMKITAKNAFLAVCLISLLISCKPSAKSEIEITGTVKGSESGTVYLSKFYNKMFFVIDSSKITSGTFTFSKDLPAPELYGLSTDTTQYPLFVFLNKGDKIKVELFAQNPDSIIITGSKENDLFKWYKQAAGEVKIDSFIKKNPNSIVSAYVLYREYSYRLTPEEIQFNVGLLDTSLQNTQYVKVLNDLVGVLKSVEPGNKAIDFEVADTSGNPVKLSSKFGKVLLLDFWASWCPPCRAENPNLVNVYNKYNKKGFDIFAVSLDKKSEAWKKGITDDHLTWNHVSDLAYWNSAPAKLYGIRAIPSNVLIDASGTIIGRNLFDADLDKKLEEILGKQK